MLTKRSVAAKVAKQPRAGCERSHVCRPWVRSAEAPWSACGACCEGKQCPAHLIVELRLFLLSAKHRLQLRPTLWRHLSCSHLSLEGAGRVW
jgi:hypothetical protein